MKTRELKILFVLMTMSVILTGLTCASNRINLLNDGTYHLETISSRGNTISNVHVNKVEGRLEITGTLERYSRALGFHGGHIDMAIVSHEDDVLEELSTNYVPQMSLTRRKHRREASFKVNVATIPPMGSIVRVAYHRRSKTVDRRFPCGENRAASNI